MKDLVAGQTYETFEGEAVVYIGMMGTRFLFSDMNGHEISLTLDDLQQIYPLGTHEEEVGREMSASFGAE